jgi:hypothetical protein
MPRNRRTRAAVTAAGLAVMAGWLASAAAAGGAAQTFDSTYTSIAAKQCRKTVNLKIEDTEYAVSRICTGTADYKVYIDEEDLRETLTVGKTLKQALQEPAADDHYGAFNGYEDKVEWRRGRDGKPFALIVGWFFADNANLEPTGRPKSARLLVVMRLPPGPVCKVAYIDRAANSDANALARKAADELARNFKCGADTLQVIGKRGRAIASIYPGDNAEEAPKP